MLVTESCPTLCDPMDYSSPGSSVHGILQARILEWLPFPSPGDLPDSGVERWSPALQGILYHRSHQEMHMKTIMKIVSKLLRENTRDW